MSEKQQGQKTEENRRSTWQKKIREQWAKKLEQKHKEWKKSSSITVPEYYLCIQIKLPKAVSNLRVFFLFILGDLLGFVSLLNKIVKLQFLFGFKSGLSFSKALSFQYS